MGCEALGDGDVGKKKQLYVENEVESDQLRVNLTLIKVLAFEKELSGDCNLKTANNIVIYL